MRQLSFKMIVSLHSAFVYVASVCDVHITAFHRISIRLIRLVQNIVSYDNVNAWTEEYHECTSVH